MEIRNILNIFKLFLYLINIYLLIRTCFRTASLLQTTLLALLLCSLPATAGRNTRLPLVSTIAGRNTPLWLVITNAGSNAPPCLASNPAVRNTRLRLVSTTAGEILVCIKLWVPSQVKLLVSDRAVPSQVETLVSDWSADHGHCQKYPFIESWSGRVMVF